VAAVLGKTASQLFPPLLAAGYEQQDSLIFATGRSFTDKLELITNADGTTGWYLTQKHPVRDAEGRIVAIASVSSDLDRPKSDDPRLTAVADAIEQIHRGYREQLRIESIAQSSGMSLSQLERRMRSILRLSPRQLLTQTRVEAAAKSLLEPPASLSQIASDCGFYDQAQFCRQFRAATGLTPGKYRASARQ
jgi:AraC-like DNA-binding protein